MIALNSTKIALNMCRSCRASTQESTRAGGDHIQANDKLELPAEGERMRAVAYAAAEIYAQRPVPLRHG